MARCGIRLRYPVKIIICDDDGTEGEGPVIGDAETLALALELAESQGFHIREADDGGQSRLALSDADSPAGFRVTVYPE